MILMRATESEKYLIADDPVRPELDFNFRVGANKDFFIFVERIYYNIENLFSLGLEFM